MKKKLLFILMLIIGSFSFAENIVITSIQPLYSLTSYLTKGTDIKVYTPFGSDVSMTMSKDSIREEGFDLAIAKKAQAVVDIAKVWPEDVIYGKARMNKINIVEIDASHPYDEKMTTIFFSDYSNGKVNPYIWMGSKNLVRMVNIIGRDLIRLYPKNKAKIEKNITKFTADLLKIENEANEKLLSVGNAEVISLSENLQYFLNDMNIYTEYVDYDSVTAENVAKLIKDKGIKVVVSDRWLKKNVIKALKDAGGEFVIINTLDIPMDKDGKTVKLSDFKGKKVYINMWASWCGPCMREIPELEKTYQKLKDNKDIVFLSMTSPNDKEFKNQTPQDKGKDVILNKAKELGVTYPVLFDVNDRFIINYAIRSFPTHIFINSDGTIGNRIAGAVTEESLTKEIEKLK